MEEKTKKNKSVWWKRVLLIVAIIIIILYLHVKMMNKIAEKRIKSSFERARAIDEMENKIKQQEEVIRKCFEDNNVEIIDLNYDTQPYLNGIIIWEITINIDYETEYKEQKFFNTKLNKDLWNLYTNRNINIDKIYFDGIAIDFVKYNNLNKGF